MRTGSPGSALAALPTGTFVHHSDLPGTSSAVSSALARAQRAGQITPVRKGLFFKGAKTRYGITRPTAEAVALAVLGPTGVGPTGVSAARALGLTTQVPVRPAFTIAGPVPVGIAGVEVSKRNNMGRRSLSFVEIALLELLRGDWKYVVDGGWRALVEAVAQARTNGTVDLASVQEAATGERSPALRRNLARLTDALTASE